MVVTTHVVILMEGIVPWWSWWWSHWGDYATLGMLVCHSEGDGV